MIDRGKFFRLPGSTCLSLKKACCETTVCAMYDYGLHIQTDVITGAMWSPITMKCAGGGIWYDLSRGVYVQMNRPGGVA